MITSCIFLFCCGTASGINPSTRIGDGQRIGKSRWKREEGRGKENEHMYVWGRRNLHENFGNVAFVCLFSMVILIIHKQLRRIFAPLLWYLSSFCTFCRFISYLFAFCPIASLEMNIDF